MVGHTHLGGRLFHSASGGYPQFVPTIWAVAYLVTGSQVQYFAFYCYLVLIVAPLVLNAMVLGRVHWWLPLVQFSVFVCFITGTIEPGLRSNTLPAAFPDWVVVVFLVRGSRSVPVATATAPTIIHHLVAGALS